jgi:hypothetical protein
MQRQNKKKLDRGDRSKGMTAARVAKLDEIGFMWRAPDHGGCANDAGWEVWLAKLETYQLQHGDCNVPTVWAEDPGLGIWVNNQRQRKKALDRGDPSPGMTAARAAKLEVFGFMWQAPAHGGCLNDAGWKTQLAKLKDYKRRWGSCNVPNCWAADPQLGNWVSSQRHGKKKLDRGEPSKGMTAARAAKLEPLGFAWVGVTAVSRFRGPE